MSTIFTPKRTRGLLLTSGLLFLSLYTAFWIFYFAKPTGISAAWWDDTWSYRKAIPVTYTGSSNLTEYQVLIDGLDTATLVTNGQLQSTCADLRFLSQVGEVLDYSIVGATCNTSDTEIWVKIDSIPAASVTIWMYYGNPSAAAYQSESKTFSYTTGAKTVGYVLGDRYTGLDVISMEDGNSVTHNATTRTLNARETTTITPSNYGAVTATKLFNMDDTPDGTDMVVPVSWAGTEFMDYTRSGSGSEEFWVVSPWGSATVRLYVAGTEQTGCGSPWTVTSSGTDINCAIADSTQYRVTSDIPVLVSREENTGDVFPMYPATSDYLYGFNSTGIYVAAGPNGADYRYITSAAASETNPADLTANGIASSGGGSGSWYSGAANRFYSTSSANTLGIATKADSDGGEGTTFVKRIEFGTKFGSALQAEYVAVVSDQAATCTLYNTDGSVIGTKTLTSSNAVVFALPVSTDFGRGASTAITTGKWNMTCNKPVYAVYQNASGTDDEHNLWSYPMMRQFTYPTPAVGTLAAEEKGQAPVAYWKFDDASGTSAQDATANNNDGTISGATWQTEDQCISGKCLSFDGTNDVVTVGNTVAGVQTVAFWVRPMTTSEQFIDLNGSAYIQASSGTVSATGFTSPTIYVDGKVSSTIVANKWQYVSVTTASALSASAIKVGQISTNYGQGFIDEVKIYNYARTAAQIKADYRSRGTTKGSAATLSLPKGQGDFLSNGLVGYWKMDEASWTNDCTATSITDSSGNGNNGKSCPATSGPTGGAVGKFGNGGSFDGIEEYIDIGTSTSGIPRDVFTVSAWIKSNTTASQTIAMFGDEGGNQRIWRLQTSATGKAYGQANDIGTTLLTGTTTITNNSWHHVVISQTGTTSNDVFRLFVDGVQEGSTAPLRAAAVNPNKQLTFGVSQELGSLSGEYFNGSIDDVRIYNRALSPKEVRDLYSWAPGPVGYWNFDEKTGASVQDISGNGYVGTWNGTGTTHWTAGKYGSAGNFNGSSDFVNIPDNTNLRFGTGNFTVESWVKFPISGGGPAWEGIVTKGYTTSAPANTWGLVRNSTNTNQVVFQDSTDAGGAWNANLTSATFSNGWHHIAATRNGTTYSIYSDGVLTSSGTNTVVNLSTTAALKIGSDATPRYLNGSVDDVRIYNYARTQKQIVEDLNAGHPSVGSPVGSAVGYWKFDEGYGTTAFNSGSGGSALNGTLTQMASPATSTSGWTNSGKFGKALVFDGSNDYVQINDTSDLFDFDNDFSFGAWFKTTDSGNIINIISRGTTNDWQYFVGKNASNQLWCKIYQSNSGLGYLETTTTVTINDNNWHNVNCIVSDTILYAYLDGKLVDTDNTTSGTRDTASNGELYIGKFDYSSTYAFVGSIDEVKIYNYALTADEVKTDYNRGSSMVLGTLSDTSGLTGGSIASTSATAQYCQPGSSDPCSAPVGEWNFEEKTGGSANDTSGNGNTGTLASGTTWTTGKVGSAIDFNGSTGIVSTSITTHPTSFTVEAWANADVSDGTYDTIISKFTASPSYNGFFLRHAGGTTTASVYSGGTGYASTATITAGGWNHWAMIFDGTTIKLYKNGVLADSDAGTMGSNTTALIVGGNYGGATEPFNGKIDQVRYFNYARTPAQIAWDYNRGGPVGWWKFDECQGTTAFDAAGNSNSGTITIGATGTQASVGTCAASAATAWYNGATGKFNSSLNFDGADDNVTLADNAVTVAENLPWTLSTWIKSNNFGDGTYFPGIFGNELTTGKFQRLQFYNGISLSIVDQDNTGGGVSNLWTHGMSTGQWYQVTVVNNGSDSNNLTLYINSISKGTISMATTAWEIRQIGGRGSTGHKFDGQIDDVRVYNYALTSQQIKLLNNEGSAVRFGPASGSP